MLSHTVYLIVGSSAIVVLFALVGEGLTRIVRRIGHRAGVKPSTLLGIRDVGRAIWVILAVVAVTVFADLATVLTVLVVSTIGGLIVSLALQATLSNVIAGILLFQDGTLRLGDSVTYSGVTGKVVRITLRTSWIMTDQGALAAVANSQLMNGPLINRTATERLSVKYLLAADSTPPSSGPSRGASGVQDPLSTTPSAARKGGGDT